MAARTEYSHLTDEELLKKVFNTTDKVTDLEVELATRLERTLDEYDAWEEPTTNLFSEN